MPRPVRGSRVSRTTPLRSVPVFRLSRFPGVRRGRPPVSLGRIAAACPSLLLDRRPTRPTHEPAADYSPPPLSGQEHEVVREPARSGPRRSATQPSGLIATSTPMRCKLYYGLVLTLQYIIRRLGRTRTVQAIEQRLRLITMRTATKKTSNDLLSVGQAAEILSVHPDTLRRWAAGGLLKVYRVGPRRDRRFHRSEISRLMTRG